MMRIVKQSEIPQLTSIGNYQINYELLTKVLNFVLNNYTDMVNSYDYNVD
jgi:hypothetical protein